MAFRAFRRGDAAAVGLELCRLAAAAAVGMANGEAEPVKLRRRLLELLQVMVVVVVEVVLRRRRMMHLVGLRRNLVQMLLLLLCVQVRLVSCLAD